MSELLDGCRATIDEYEKRLAAVEKERDDYWNLAVYDASDPKQPYFEATKREELESTLSRLRKALKVLSKAAKRFQLETDEKKRNGRIWDRLYEAIEKADAAIFDKEAGK